MLQIGRIERLIAQPFQEGLNRLFVLAILGQEFVERFLGKSAVARIVMLGPRGAGDRQPIGQQMIGMQP